MMNSVKKCLLLGLVIVGVAGASYAAGKAKAPVNTPAAELTWEALAPGMPLQMGKLWGDRAKGEYAMLLKLPGGFDSGMHAHTLDYHAVLVQGTWVHTNEGDTAPAKEMAPGSYVMQPGKAMHNDACKSKTDCIIFVHQHGKGDFIPGKKPDEKGAEKPAAAPKK